MWRIAALLLLILVVLVALNLRAHLGMLAIVGGAEKPPVLIVDVANMYVGWYMETTGQKVPYATQSTLMERYIQFMRAHYKLFKAANPHAKVHYVFKNHQLGSGPAAATNADVIKPPTWTALKQFVRDHSDTTITIAEDYARYRAQSWKDPRNHYLRGRDDYMLFEVARAYKRAHTPHWIMSDDKFDDFQQLAWVPKFVATTIPGTTETIRPRPNSLGSLKDFKIVGCNPHWVIGQRSEPNNVGYV
jgi:hypothetical protein